MSDRAGDWHGALGVLICKSDLGVAVCASLPFSGKRADVRCQKVLASGIGWRARMSSAPFSDLRPPTSVFWNGACSSAG
jgi:hypothetical protein